MGSIASVHKRGVRLVAVAAFMSVLGACGSSSRAAGGAPANSHPSTGGASPGLGSVTLRTGASSLIGEDIPFVVAKERGYYKKAGLNVTIGLGTGYATALRTVASGSDQYAETDVASVAKAVAQGLPVKSVAIYVASNPAGIIYHKNRPITSPESIKGWKIGGTAGSGSEGIFNTWVTLNKMSASSFTLENIPGHAKAVLFSQGKLDGYIGLAFDDYPDAQKVYGANNVGFYFFSQSGIQVPGLAIAASSSEIGNHPSRVKAFVKATYQGAEWAVAHPDQVGALAQHLVSTTDAALVDRQWAVVAKEISKPTSSQPWGYQSAGAFQQTAKLFAPSLQNNVSKFYTNAYLP